MAQEAGFTPQAVPPKILFPLLEGASFEEDESLHDMWAALLANAASPENREKVKPGFIATLKNLSVDEAALLNWIFGQRTGLQAPPFNRPLTYSDLMNAYASLGFVEENDGLDTIAIETIAFETCLQGLEAERLIHAQDTSQDRSLTFRGLAFVLACRPPKPKE